MGFYWGQSNYGDVQTTILRVRPEARDSLLITLLILLLTRQHVSSLGPGDRPSRERPDPKTTGHEGQPTVW